MFISLFTTKLVSYQFKKTFELHKIVKIRMNLVKGVKKYSISLLFITTSIGIFNRNNNLIQKQTKSQDSLGTIW